MVILPTAYWPPISYIQLLLNGEGMIEVQENYQKRSIRNKANILTSQGQQTLSVPLVKGKHSKLPISKVLISHDEQWQRTHIQSISTAYRNAPYYQFYIDDITALIESKEPNLLKYNLSITQWVLNKFNKEHRLANVTSAYTGVTYKYATSIKPYRQVYEQQLGFVNTDISILDLIFNVGYEIPLYFRN